MNLLMIKQMSLLAIIIGIILAFISAIPYVGFIALLVEFFLVSVLVLIYMKKNDLIGIFTSRTAAIYGSLIGLVSFLAYSLVLIPICLFLNLMNSLFIHQMAWYSIFKIIFNMGLSGFFLLIMIISFISLLVAMFNAFSAMVAIMILQQFDAVSKQKEKFKIDIEIDE